ncbi:hypothetical protein [Rheinheimera texasensis]|uniref:hypothetical protein n=1 Tax=Rheinheimera texasensis TaxID=306205 RepID=UPI000A81ED56|nr:hypothetical protein [Rheinheimera texasensis]
MMKKSGQCLPKILFPLLLLSLTACAQAGAVAEPTDKSPDKVTEKKQTKVLVLNDAYGKTFKWDSSQSPAELEKALAELPAEKRDKIRKIVEQMKSTAPGEPQVLVKTLDGDDLDLDVRVITDKVVMHKMVAGEGHEFELIKKLLANGKFSKEQLQELQKQLDSKF